MENFGDAAGAIARTSIRLTGPPSESLQMAPGCSCPMALDKMVRGRGGEDVRNTHGLMTLVIQLMRGLRKSRRRLILVLTQTYIPETNETILLNYHRIVDYLNLELKAMELFVLEAARGHSQIPMVSC